MATGSVSPAGAYQWKTSSPTTIGVPLASSGPRMITTATSKHHPPSNQATTVRADHNGTRQQTHPTIQDAILHHTLLDPAATGEVTSNSARSLVLPVARTIAPSSIPKSKSTAA
ncbi:hypothetical protein ACLOJK_036679, partial [Asimina triloba]